MSKDLATKRSRQFEATHEVPWKWFIWFRGKNEKRGNKKYLKVLMKIKKMKLQFSMISKRCEIEILVRYN